MSLDTHIQSACIVFRLPVAPLKCVSTARLDSMNPGSLKLIFPSHDNMDFVMSKNCRQKVGKYFWLHIFFKKNICIYLFVVN